MIATKKDDTLILIPETDLIASAVENLRDYFILQIKEHTDVSKIILDARGIDIVDSLGVNLIIGLYKQVESESKVFEIISAGENFLKVSNFFRLNKLFEIKS